MRHYETIYILRPSLAEGEYDGAQKTLNKMKKGYYVLLEYCGEAGLTEELERVFKLDDKVLKYQTVKLSDNADPEALLPKEEAPEEVEQEADAVAEESPEQGVDETESEEVKNGI